jgi:hypothetical protein
MDPLLDLQLVEVAGNERHGEGDAADHEEQGEQSGGQLCVQSFGSQYHGLVPSRCGLCWGMQSDFLAG